MSRNIGPALPPGWNKTNENSEKSSDSDDQDEFDFKSTPVQSSDNVTYPSSPQNSGKSQYGPKLPPRFSKTSENHPSLYGPKLPPDFSKTEEIDSTCYGPQLPPHLVKKSEPKIIRQAPPPVNERENIDEDSEDDDCIGPSLTEFHSSNKSFDADIAKSYEDRAKKMKDKLLYKEEEVQKRDVWMTQLPDILGNKIGLGARTFSKRSGPSTNELDRSGWTETPKERERKEQTEELQDVYRKPTLEEIATHSRNIDLNNKIEKYNEAKRKESLMDIHKKNLKRKANQDKDKKEKRREFDRDKDLNIQKIDKDGANNIIAKSKVFNSKFSHGSNHFL